MSAFVVSHTHISALLTFARDKRLQGELSYAIKKNTVRPDLSWDRIGAVLLAENERSVCHRYPDCAPGNAPGVIGEKAITYRFKPYAPFTTMPFAKKLTWVLKACDCYDYQACETDDYNKSIAFDIIEKIRGRAVRCLPGYEEAPWGIDS